MASQLTVGQKLVFVPTETKHRSPSQVTVSKVGRKWAQLDNNLRIDLVTWRADGGEYTSPGRCYSTLEEYEAVVRQREAWHKFCKAVNGYNTCAASEDEIRQAAAILKLHIE